MSIYEHEFLIGINDVTKNNGITDKAILKMFEDVAGMHSEMIHFGINDMTKTKLSWIILNWKIQILNRPKYNEKVTIRTWIRNPNKVYLYRDFEMYDDANNLLVIGTSKWALINIENKELARIPEKTIKEYGEEAKSVFEKRKLEKITEPEQYINKIENYKILRSDIDINEHVHNLNYLNIAYEVMPKEETNNEKFSNIEISYKKQIKYGDEIICFYSKINNESIVVIKSKDETVIHAIIKFF